MKKTVSLIALSLFVAVPAFAFSPTVENRDSKNYSYEVVCGSTTSNSTLSHNSMATINTFKGCRLVVKGAGSSKLDENMKCVIKDGSMDCR